MSRAKDDLERLHQCIYRVRFASDTVDHAVYNSTAGIDVFRDPNVFLCAQASTAALAFVLVSLGWPR